MYLLQKSQGGTSAAQVLTVTIHSHDALEALGDGRQSHIQNSNKKSFNTQVSRNGFSQSSLGPSFKDVERLEFLCAFVKPPLLPTDKPL